MNTKTISVRKLKFINSKLFIAFAVLIFIQLALPLLSSPKYKGVLDTTVYTSGSDGDAGKRSYTQVHEWILFDLNIMKDFSFHLNNRFTYIHENSDTQEDWNLNLYYIYLEYMFLNKHLTVQLGRIMEVSNMFYLFYDGASVDYKFNMLGHKFSAKLYGGVIVNDDYIEEDNKLYSLSSFDYRNLFKGQRSGDYVVGAKTNYFIKKIANFGLDYQVIMNESELAEHYLSVDFDTVFSKKVKVFGYGTFDLIEGTPSNALLASRLNLFKSMLILVQYEYFRPVFIKDSYFWTYFLPYGNHELSATLIYFITKNIIADAKYGRIIYDSKDAEGGNHLSAGIEHKDLYKFGLKFNFAYMNGAEGDRINLQLTATRKISIVKLLLGGGTVFYKDDFEKDEFKNAFFIFLGADSRVLKSLILSVTGEYYKAPYTDYDLRGIFSVKYLF
ncbi:hypothetical protein ACFL20_07800 [Spirochaetota bacterium]